MAVSLTDNEAKLILDYAEDNDDTREKVYLGMRAGGDKWLDLSLDTIRALAKLSSKRNVIGDTLTVEWGASDLPDLDASTLEDSNQPRDYPLATYACDLDPASPEAMEIRAEIRAKEDKRRVEQNLVEKGFFWGFISTLLVFIVLYLVLLYRP
jgi:hypothetical protein